MNEDGRMHETQSQKYVVHDDREPFNEVMDHFNTVNRYRRVNRIDQLPKKLQKPIQIYNFISLIAIIGTLIWSILSLFH